MRKLGPVRISWSWLLFTTAAIVLGVPLFTAGALCLRDAECRGVHKTLLIRVDRTLFNGTLRRLHLGQRLPRLPERPFAHGADAYSYVDSVAFLAVGHGLGPQLWAGGNTLPTFRRGLEIGFRVFEVDLALTTDDHLVCYHGSDQHELSRLSYAGYLDIMRSSGLEPCRFADLVAIARLRRDVRFVLDVKNRFDAAYRVIRAEVGDSATGKSFIPLVYDFEQAAQFQQDQFFAGELFTSYLSALTTSQIFDAARRSGIRVVTLTLERFRNLRGEIPEELIVLVHTVNDPILADELRRQGARGIYTSYLTPQTVPELFTRSSDRLSRPGGR